MAMGTGVFVLVVVVSVAVMGVLNLERTKRGGEAVEYESQGWFRECVVWDEENRRFLVSFMEGGVGQIGAEGIEETLVKDADYAGNGSLGFKIDRPRNRIVVAVADLFGTKYSAVAAYDMATWQRLFLTQLISPGNTKSMVDDVAIDPEGNAYLTDAKANVIWKVDNGGSLVSVFNDTAFRSAPSKLPFNLVGLNGIVYHPEGFLLVVHMFAGVLFKVSLDGSEVRRVEMSSFLLLGDGIALLSPERLVVAGTPSARVVESTDNWQSAKLTHRYVGPMHRIATAVTVKEGKALVSHALGMGWGRRKHLITEAIFSPVTLPN